MDFNTKEKRMIVRYDEKDEELLRRLLDNNLAISLDVANGKDKCYEVTYCITKGCDIIKTDTISLKEEK